MVTYICHQIVTNINYGIKKKTEKRLLEAVSKIIEEEGFTQIGINRIDKEGTM